MTDLKEIAVLVTRPEHQADSICQQLRKAGATVVAIPALAICLMENADFTVAGFDRVFFVSANAVNGFCHPPAALQAAKVAAIGLQTARSLEQAGYEVSCVPSSGFTSEDLLAMEELQLLDGQRCLVVRGNEGRNLLAEVLQQRGARVESLEVYRRQPLARVDDEAWQGFMSARRRVAMFTSADSLRYFRAALREEAQKQFDRIDKIAGSERIAQAAKEMTHPDAEIVVADNPSDNAMMNALRKWAENEASKT